MPNKPTIVAIATPPGHGGVGIVRLSGPKALSISKTLTALSLKPRQATFCTLKDEQGQALDSAVVIYFKAPHSYTGEEIVEFQCHGSPVLLDVIVEQCTRLGARLAEPGEFTLTAFLNGKMDLVQAEAVSDLIHASSEAAARMAQQSLSGAFSNHIHTLEQALVQLRVLIEAGIDFPEEEIDILSDNEVGEKLRQLLNDLSALERQAKQGAIMKEGIRVVIAGEPNAGKSTVMNLLAGKDIAIVTPIAGTTRDLMRESVSIEGIPLILIDTAGLHQTDCVVEQEGIKRAKQAIQEADLVLWMIDVQNAQAGKASPLDETLSTLIPSQVPIIKVWNKLDLLKGEKEEKNAANELYISAKTGHGEKALHQAILSAVGYKPQEGVFIARRRHLQALSEVKTMVLSALTQLESTRALEFIAEDLRQAQLALNQITGEFSSDDLLGEIFSSFCIGK